MGELGLLVVLVGCLKAGYLWEVDFGLFGYGNEAEGCLGLV